tara:strand:- start:1191 stop:1457 length:267 start_codon:yes stop_codon:yes gene_type:complete
MSHDNRFPRSLAAIGLNPGFTHQQFCFMMELERSDYIRELAHQEWLNIQGEEYENSPYRWYLSYVSMKSEYTRDMVYPYKSKNKNKEP